MLILKFKLYIYNGKKLNEGKNYTLKWKMDKC